MDLMRKMKIRNEGKKTKEMVYEMPYKMNDQKMVQNKMLLCLAFRIIGILTCVTHIPNLCIEKSPTFLQ